MVIPNRKIVGEILHNYGTIRQLALEVRVAYDTDARPAIALVREVLRADARVLRDPAPLILIRRLEPSAIVIGALPWVKVADYWVSTGELYERIVAAFRARHIVIPVPQHDVRLVRAEAPEPVRVP